MLASTAFSHDHDPHRTLASDPWCYPASFMVGMLRFGMPNQKESAANEVPAHLCRPGWRVAFRRSRIADDEEVGAPRCPAVRGFGQLSGIPRPPHPHPGGHARGGLAYGPRAGAYGQAGWFG